MVQAQPKSDTLKLTNALEKKIKELEPTLILEGLILHNGLFRPANFIEEAFSNVQKDILIGATLVLAVLFLFLLNLKTALISAIAIPLSLLSSILILVYQGVALNIMVLGGLVIALGEVVDDAIIDTENIFRRLKENKLKKNPENPLKVVINASMEIRHSVISATVIVVLAFSPLLFIPGVAGRLFEPLGLAYIYALTSSLIIALTITPALCTLLLLKNSSFKTEESPTVLFLKRNYVILLNKIETAPKEVAATTIFFLLIGLSTIPLFKVEFIPELREGHYIVHMTAVPGTSSAEMNRVGKLVTKKIRNIKNVKSTAQWVGRAENGADTFGMNYSEIQVEVGPLTGSEQEETVSKIKLALTQVDSENKSQPFPGFTFGIHTFLSERIEETVSGYTADFVVEIVGLDLEKIQNDAKKITQIMQKIQGAENVKMVAPSSTPQIKVDILWDKVSAFGLQADEVIRTISTVFHGIQVGEINNNERIIPIIVTTTKKIKKDIENLKEVPFISKEGIKFRLKDISNIYFDTGRSKILRDGGKRIQAITTDINKRDFLFSRGVTQFKLVKSLGATEVYPFTGSSEIITDITSTGETLKANNLRVLKDGEILKSQACFMQSRLSFIKHGIKKIVKLIT